jgi:hypothetical protein
MNVEVNRVVLICFDAMKKEIGEFSMVNGRMNGFILVEICEQFMILSNLTVRWR